MAKKQTEVLIIGGGWTGVAAATELAKLGVDFQLIEADPTRLGGRAYSFEYNPNGAGAPKLFWEHGAQYVGQDQTAIWGLIQEHCPDQLVDGYALRKDGVRLLFWSGQSFDEPDLRPEGSFKAAEACYAKVGDVDVAALRRWLAKARTIQWDYANIVKRKGKLVRLRLDAPA